jgi:hypothetical protein
MNAATTSRIATTNRKILLRSERENMKASGEGECAIASEN